MGQRHFSRILALVALTVLYFLAGKLGLRLAFVHASASAVWPPAGIALAALLLFGYGTWPAIFLGAFLVNLTASGNVATSLAIGVGNTLEAVCGAWLVNRFANGICVFDRAQDVFKFALAAAISTAVSPSIGLTSLALAGYADWSNYGPIWTTWWLGDATGDLIFAPMIILWGVKPRWRWNGKKDLEIALILLLLLALGEAIFRRLAADQRQELSSRICLRADPDLDGIPHVAARNRYRHICSLGDRYLGNAAELRSVCAGNRESVAADLAEFNSNLDPNSNGAGCSHG